MEELVEKLQDLFWKVLGQLLFLGIEHIKQIPVTGCCLLRFFNSSYVLNSLSRFISRPKRFRPFDYACLSVELLQSSTVDYIVRCSRLYSPLQ